MSDKDKRESPRFDVNVKGGIAYTIDAVVTNMSAEGAAIETNSRLTVGRKYLIRVFDVEKPLRLEGQIMWCTLSKHVKNEKGEVVPIYRAGLKFADIMAEGASEIGQFITRHKVEKIEKRLFGRFNLSPESNAAKIDYQHEFRVKKISLSGMLIEFDVQIEVDSLIDLSIKLDNEIFSCKGKIAYLKEVVEEQMKKYFLGIQFLGMSEDSRKVLSSYISGLTKEEESDK